MDWPKRQHRRPGRRSKNDKAGDNDETLEGDDQARLRSKANIPKAHLHTLSEFPKQFILSSRREDEAASTSDLRRSFSDTDAVDWLNEVTRDPEELQRLEREIESFTDMDYVLPSHLDQLLRQEGVDDKAVDTTVALGKVWHDRAAYLSYIYHIKRRYLNHIYHIKQVSQPYLRR